MFGYNKQTWQDGKACLLYPYLASDTDVTTASSHYPVLWLHLHLYEPYNNKINRKVDNEVIIARLHATNKRFYLPFHSPITTKLARMIDQQAFLIASG